jgi:Mu-like prophage major head subunit gpT
MNPYGVFGGPNKLIEAYADWRDDRLAKYDAGVLMEADSKADFPEFLFGIIRTALWAGYERIAPQFERYATIENAPDFRERRLRGLNALTGIGYVGDHGEYPGMRRTERPSAPLAVDTYGGVYSLTRQLIINDDTGELLNRNPADMGFNAGNFVAETVVALIVSNPLAADGAVFFSSGRGNQGTAPLSEDALADAITAMETQRDDDGYRIRIRANLLVVQNARQEMIARRIVNSTTTGATINYTGGTAGVGSAFMDKGTLNPVQGILNGDQILRETFLPDANDWYLFADPGSVPAFAIGFLNGERRPFIGLKNPEVRNALGPGVDPYTFELDSVDFKVRLDFGAAAVDPRGAYRSVVP